MRVSRNLEEAIANYELFAVTARDPALIARVNTLKINGGFNAISVSLHHVVVIALCRVWDKRKDVASLWSLRRLLLQPSYRTEREELVRRFGGQHAFDESRFNTWCMQVEVGSRLESLKAITRTRHKWLAHTTSPEEQYQETARQEVYGDERKVIEMTIPLIKEANGLIGFNFLEFNALGRRWANEAENYWRKIGANHA